MEDRTGRVVIDRQLNIVTADDRFYAMVGEGNYKSLLNCVDEEGAATLRKALASLTDFHTEQAGCYLLKTVGGPRWFLIRARLDRQNPEDPEKSLYYLEYFDMDDLQGQVNSLLNIIRESNACLELCDRQLFRYDRTEDDMHIFTGNMVHKMTVFHGTLEEWRAEIIRTAELDDRGREELEALIADLKDAPGAFEHIMTGRQHSSSVKERVRYLGMGLTMNDTCPTAVGMLSLLTPEGKDENLRVFDEGNWDGITGMYNKTTILKYAEQVIARKPDHPVHIAILDLDNFKTVNDIYGHMAGDEVLGKVASIIREAVSRVGVAGRFGGDEILMVIERADSLMELRAILRTIRTNIEYAYKNTGRNYGVTCSIGVATLGTGGDTFDELFAMADKMLYGAKRKGKNRYIIYTPEVHEALLETEAFTPARIVSSVAGDQEALVNRVTGTLLGKKRAPLLDCLTGVGEAFGIDEIVLLREEEALYRWTSGTGAGEKVESLACLDEDGVTQWLARSNPLVVDHTEDIEHVYPHTWQMLRAVGAYSAVVFNVGEEGRRGFLIVVKKGLTSRKWAGPDVAYLMFIANAVALRLEMDE